MRRVVFVVAALAGFGSPSQALTEGDPKRGAELYRACVACHALEPALHLSGPSLGDVLGRAAGTAEGFVRYSPGLKAADFKWNATALDGWLKDPQEMIPGNYMAFDGINDPDARADLVAFLEIAGKPGGGEKAVGDGLIPASWLRADAPQPIGDAPAQARVTAIRHCGDSYFIKTEDGTETPYWEKNIRLKIDSVETGPRPGVPVILGAGMAGDRFSVIFSSLADLKSLVEEKC
jgi:cytochrome c